MTTKAASPANASHGLASAPIGRLFLSFCLTSVLGMAMQVITAVMDGRFVGAALGEIGLGAIAIIYPLWTLSVATGSLFGTGAASMIGRRLGAGDAQGARAVIGQTFWVSLLFGVVFGLAAEVWLEPILTLLGARGPILATAVAYGRPWLLAFPLYVMGLTMFYCARAVGRPGIALAVQVIPAAIAIPVEYLLVVRWGVGIAGSALTAWGIVFGSWALLALPFLFGDPALRIRWSDLRIDPHLMGEVLRIGLPGMVIQVAPAVVAIAINNQIARIGTATDAAAYGVMNGYIVYSLLALANAVGFAVLPIAAYNYGAGLYRRVRRVLAIGVGSTVGIMATFLMLVLLFSGPIVGFFTGGDPRLVAVTQEAMRVFTVMFPAAAIALAMSNYYQAIGRHTAAIVNSLTRDVFFVLPLLFTLPHVLGMPGVWLSQPIADTLAGTVGLAFLIVEIRQLTRMSAPRAKTLPDKVATPVG